MKRPSIDAHVPNLTKSEIKSLKQATPSSSEWREAVYQLKRKRIFGHAPPDLYQIIEEQGILDNITWNTNE